MRYNKFKYHANTPTNFGEVAFQMQKRATIGPSASETPCFAGGPIVGRDCKLAWFVLPRLLFVSDETYNSVETALEYVFTARENCEWGTLKPLPLLFDTSAWSQLTDPAIR